MEEENKKQTISEDSQSEIDQAKKERDEYLEGWKRAKADYLNYKREENERFSAWGKMANEALVRDLLLVLDSVNVGLSMISPDSAERKGIELLRTQMEDVLKRYGLTKVEAPAGKPYDPSLEEAVGEVESDHPPGNIAEELEKGYALGGKVLRPAKVRISKGKI